MSMTDHRRVVILGAGFGGLGVAREMAKLYPDKAECEITIVDQHNFSLFTPMLTEVVGGEIDEQDIICAIRDLSPRVTFEQGRVKRVDVENKRATITVGGEEPGIPAVERTLEADHLVVALGSVTNFHDVPGVQQHSLTMKTVDDARVIRNRALALLERADEEHDPDERRKLLTFVVGGGGFSGVETMAALNDSVRDSARHFKNVQPGDIRTILLQPGSRLLPEIGGELASYAMKQLQRRGVEIGLHTEIGGAGEDYVEADPPFRHEQRITSHLLIWTAGVTPSPVLDTMDVKRGRHHGIVVDSCCRVPDHDGVWALGDCAEIPHPGAASTYAPTAQNAIREGPQVARNIAAAMRGDAAQPFVYRPIGELALVGKREGIASLYGFKFSGILAWAMWRAVYLAKLPRMEKRIRVGVGWVLDLIFGRDIATTPGAASSAAHDASQNSQAA